MRQSGVLSNGRQSCEDLILTLKADLIFCLYSCQLLFALTDMSTFLGKKILVEPFICQSKLGGSMTPSQPPPWGSHALSTSARHALWVCR